MNEAEHLLAVQNELGEGPLWNPSEQALYWVDIKRARLYRYYPVIRKYEVYELSQPIMAVGQRSSGGFVTACGSGFAFWNPITNTFSPIIHPESDKPGNRFNDGAVDPRGRFWAGTMSDSDSGNPHGSLYRLDADLSAHRMVTEVMISNGIAWTSDQKTMYYTDSNRHAIFAYDYDAATGAISNRRTFVTIPEAEGVPDGLTLDSEGYVWSALWGGWKVVRFDPTGKRDREISVPAAQVTSCAFGGAELNELYITTARTGLNEQARREQPFAGDLFRLNTDVTGVEEPLFVG
jgi:sugar lactone lactonase YvrE